jgi:hypothetical protein
MSMVLSQDGTRIAFDKAGSGPPAILVGGAFTRLKGQIRVARNGARGGCYAICNRSSFDRN